MKLKIIFFIYTLHSNEDKTQNNRCAHLVGSYLFYFCYKLWTVAQSWYIQSALTALMSKSNKFPIKNWLLWPNCYKEALKIIRKWALQSKFTMLSSSSKLLYWNDCIIRGLLSSIATGSVQVLKSQYTPFHCTHYSFISSVFNSFNSAINSTINYICEFSNSFNSI